ncbi:hypothetical protein SY88_05380 [Clostridiales bacterium PH28_bin88]|nr:hypothetical protein SY88_05380 [Clostridiales bacterium PH28_bin88]
MNGSVSKRLKIMFMVCLFGASLVAAISGIITMEEVPPYPDKVVSASGKVITTGSEIMKGQSTFQQYGLMDLGSVWGHGTYRGADFTAETLHLVGIYMREYYAKQKYQQGYANLGQAEKAAVDALALSDLKENRYDRAKGTLTLSEAQVLALDQVRSYYGELFAKGDPQKVISEGTIKDAGQRTALADFFFWTAWAAGTLRPDADHTYTNNWPPDESVGNQLSTQAVTWTVVSIIMFMAFLGLVAWLFHWRGFNKGEAPQFDLAKTLAGSPVSASQVKTAKYFLIAVTLFLLQTLMGGYLAHQTTNPGTFYGLDAIAKLVPYNWAKSWHLQLAVFWVATAWIGSALYFAPILGGREPKKQGFLVDLLFVAVVLVAVGSLVGEVLGLKGLLGGRLWFWLGHQGWEYLELGRLWQILLFVGLLVWLLIVARAVKDRLSAGADKWDLPNFYVYSAIGIVIFFAFGFFYSDRTNLTIADFWRWWVVHTWVEGLFEFFAAAAMALVMVRTGLASKEHALRAAYLTASLALATGIIGVGHHYYWFGQPSFWLGLGSVLAAMEPVPLVLLLGEAWQRLRTLQKAGDSFPYTWPLRFFTASAVWNFVGAGIFGFAITLPMVNYYEHSTYLTVTHGHTAFFGTYGMLAIGLMLFAYRGIIQEQAWLRKSSLLKTSFWGANVGLTLMFLVTLLPVGVLQLIASYTRGLWYARSPEFYNQAIVRWFGEIRIVPDSMIILLGVIPLLFFILSTIGRLKPVQVPEDGMMTVALDKKGKAI